MSKKMSRILPGLRLPKRQGEWAEAVFLAHAIREGLCVTRPWGDSARYDFIVDCHGQLLRIQVKSTRHQHRRGYSFMNSSADFRRLYSAKEVDYLALYVIPSDLWYIVPAQKVGRRHAICVYPNVVGSRGRFEQFRNGWDLLRSRRSPRLRRRA